MPWYTEPGSRGSLEIAQRDDGWYVTEPDAGSQVNCTFRKDPDLSAETARIVATVQRYAIGTGDDPNYVHLAAVELSDGESTATGSAPSRSKSTTGDPVLDELAAEIIGDEVLTVERSQESLVGTAKRRASEQGRDPAIDPALLPQGAAGDDE